MRENVRTQIQVCTRVATILQSCTVMKIPFIFETAGFHEKQTSVLHLDEYRISRATMGVFIKRGAQCFFGAVSSKPTSWPYFMVNMDDRPDVCKHPPMNWYSGMTNTVTVSSHPPTSGKVTYSSTPRTAEQLAAWEPGGFGSASLAAYPLVLNRYLAAKFVSLPLVPVPASVQAPVQAPVLQPITLLRS